VGREVAKYAKAKSFNESPEPKRRCWRLNYADHVSFHMDILPAAPDDAQFIAALIAAGVDREFAGLAVGITDTEHHNFEILHNDWPRSNPRGLGRWFERQMRVESFSRREQLVEATLYASVDEVPAYEWKTPLQQTIQIFKRHRDIMFKDAPDLKPISIILTTLAAKSYDGEVNLYDAVNNILSRMLTQVRAGRPRVPNPVNPAEDFADRWASRPKLEENFRAWHRQAVADFSQLPTLIGGDLDDMLRRRFDVNRSGSQPTISPRPTGPAVPAVHVAPAVRIATPPRPWAN
jgi:hypothetical protein